MFLGISASKYPRSRLQFKNFLNLPQTTEMVVGRVQTFSNFHVSSYTLLTFFAEHTESFWDFCVPHDVYECTEDKTSTKITSLFVPLDWGSFFYLLPFPIPSPSLRTMSRGIYPSPLSSSRTETGLMRIPSRLSVGSRRMRGRWEPPPPPPPSFPRHPSSSPWR